VIATLRLNYICIHPAVSETINLALAGCYYFGGVKERHIAASPLSRSDSRPGSAD
jgi:hypothetical protein